MKTLSSSTFCTGWGKYFKPGKSYTYNGNANQGQNGQITYDPNHWCLICPEGYSSGAGHTRSCDNCNTGKHSDGHRGRSRTCRNCPTGWHTLGTSANTECVKCPVGQHQNIAGHASVNCKKCHSGKYGNELGLTNCKSCARGTYTTTTSSVANEACRICEYGKYQDENARSSCKRCSAGRFLPFVGGKLDIPWVHGASDEDRSYHNTASDCINCPSGYGWETNRAKEGLSPLTGSTGCMAW